MEKLLRYGKFILLFSGFIFLISVTLPAEAEYYVVTSGPPACCAVTPCKRHVRVKPRKRVCKRVYTKSVYYMARRGCGGCAPAVPSCNGCSTNGWFASDWEAYNYTTFYTEPDVYPYYDGRDLDLATADDDPYYYPGMNIDE